MYYILIKEQQGNKIHQEFVCDTKKDLNSIREADFGDIAIVAGPPSVYLKNSQRKWILL